MEIFFGTMLALCESHRHKYFMKSVTELKRFVSVALTCKTCECFLSNENLRLSLLYILTISVKKTNKLFLLSVSVYSKYGIYIYSIDVIYIDTI